MPHNTDEINLKESVRLIVIGTVQAIAFTIAVLVAIELTIGLGKFVPM